MSRRSPRLLAAAGLGVVLTITAACGDDDDTTASTTTAAGAEVSSEACDALVGLSGAFAGDPSQAGPIIEAFETTAPAGLEEAAATMAATYTGLLEGGDPSAFGEPEFLEASGAIADAYFASCETAAELDVDGIDYGFEGLPTEISAGRVALRFTNATEHDEPHELVLFRRLPGADETVEELLALPEEESAEKLAMAGVVFADTPGAEAIAMLELEAGDYIAVCFLPTGAEDGPPHFMSGMVAELTAS